MTSSSKPLTTAPIILVPVEIEPGYYGFGNKMDHWTPDSLTYLGKLLMRCIQERKETIRLQIQAGGKAWAADTIYLELVTAEVAASKRARRILDGES